MGNRALLVENPRQAVCYCVEDGGREARAEVWPGRHSADPVDACSTAASRLVAQGCCRNRARYPQLALFQDTKLVKCFQADVPLEQDKRRYWLDAGVSNVN